MSPRRASRFAPVVLLVALALAGGALAQNETATNGTAANGTAANATAPGADAGAASNETAGDGAAADAGGVPDFAVTLFEAKDGDAYAWSITSLQFPEGATVALTYSSANAEAPHNVNVYEGLPEPLPSQIVNPGEGKTSIQFTMPNAELKYRCDIHPEMQGTITVGAFSGGGGAGGEGGHTGITAVGVHYLAYWVGVIAFAMLFVVYGLTFFLFKYGESGATTDHMDRPGAPVGSPGESRARAWLLIGVTVVMVLGGALLVWANAPKAG